MESVSASSSRISGRDYVVSSTSASWPITLSKMPTKSSKSARRCRPLPPQLPREAARISPPLLHHRLACAAPAGVPGAEGMAFIKADDTADGSPLGIIADEVSGTSTIFRAVRVK